MQGGRLFANGDVRTANHQELREVVSCHFCEMRLRTVIAKVCARLGDSRWGWCVIGDVETGAVGVEAEAYRGGY